MTSLDAIKQMKDAVLDTIEIQARINKIIEYAQDQFKDLERYFKEELPEDMEFSVARLGDIVYDKNTLLQIMLKGQNSPAITDMRLATLIAMAFSGEHLEAIIVDISSGRYVTGINPAVIDLGTIQLNNFQRVQFILPENAVEITDTEVSRIKIHVLVSESNEEKVTSDEA